MSGAVGTEPWQWPESHWRRIVDHVRAGRTLKPAAWKDGARCAVAFSFDSDHDTNELRDGGGSIGKLSQGQYGNRRGVPRILDILRRHGVPASFYVPAVTALMRGKNVCEPTPSQTISRSSGMATPHSRGLRSGMWDCNCWEASP